MFKSTVTNAILLGEACLLRQLHIDRPLDLVETKPDKMLHSHSVRRTLVSQLTVETVVQLVRKTPDAYIDLKVDMGELDLTASEAKATYEEIKQYILDKYDTKVSNLYIAQVKENYGIIERENYNKPKSENAKNHSVRRKKQ